MVTMTTIQPPSAEINFENVIFRGVGLPDFIEGQVEK